jgi:hypothetical protein
VPLTRGLLAAVAAAALVVPVLPASAHERAITVLKEPVEGAVVTGSTLTIVVAAEGTGTPAEFSLALDGVRIDATGRPGGTFGDIRVPAGESITITTELAKPGPHLLRVTPKPHERPEPETLRRFVSVGSSGTPAASGSNGATASPGDSPGGTSGSTGGTGASGDGSGSRSADRALDALDAPAWLLALGAVTAVGAVLALAWARRRGPQPRP